MRWYQLSPLLLVVWFIVSQAAFGEAESNLDDAIRKATAYLAKEVPSWIEENECASCHNQGDAARALIMSHSAGFLNDLAPLRQTFEWIEHPDQWSKNRGLPEASDQQLAMLHFAGTLLSATPIDPKRFKGSMDRAAQLLASEQSTDGAWRIVAGGQFASPITQGPLLLTGTGMRVLRQVDPARYAVNIALAERWLSDQSPRNVLEAASILISSGAGGVASDRLREACQKQILAVNNKDGGWGPYANASSEVFDTSLVVIGLTKLSPSKDLALILDRGINYILATQDETGMWMETTRPPGVVSYAHRVSTTAWATQALLTVRQVRLQNAHPVLTSP